MRESSRSIYILFIISLHSYIHSSGAGKEKPSIKQDFKRFKQSFSKKCSQNKLALATSIGCTLGFLLIIITQSKKSLNYTPPRPCTFIPQASYFIIIDPVAHTASQVKGNVIIQREITDLAQYQEFISEEIKESLETNNVFIIYYDRTHKPIGMCVEKQGSADIIDRAHSLVDPQCRPIAHHQVLTQDKVLFYNKEEFNNTITHGLVGEFKLLASPDNPLVYRYDDNVNKYLELRLEELADMQENEP